MTDKQINHEQSSVIIDGVDVSALYPDLIACMNRYEVARLFIKTVKQLDQLKRQHQGDKGLITSTGKMNYQLLQEYDKLKTALTEIKEIISKCCSSPNHTDCATYTQCIDCGRLSDEDGFQQILQKISECEVENNG